MSGISSWLQRQKRADLIELGESIGVKNLEDMRKTDIQAELESFLADNAATLSSNPRLAPYYNTRRTNLSPVKRESLSAATGLTSGELRMTKRRSTNLKPAIAAPVAPVSPDEPDSPEEEVDPLPPAPDSAISTALARTPGRTLSLASRIPLPATPAVVAQAVDRSTVAIRTRAATIYAESHIPDHINATRTTLSTVTSVLFTVAAFELYFLRPELLADRYAFTIPAIEVLGTKDYPVHVPDMFLLLTASFWRPALTWAFTSFVGPCIAGYFFNLSAANHGALATRTTSRRLASGKPQEENVIDPLTFSVVKAILSYVVYAQGVSFGFIDSVSIARINRAVYGGWQGVLAGTAVMSLVSMYDAVLRK